MKEWSLSRQITLLVLFIVGVMIVVQSFVTSYLSKNIALNQVLQSLAAQTSAIVSTLEYSNIMFQRYAQENVRVLRTQLSGEISLSTEELTITGEKSLPTLRSGDVVLNNNLRLVQAFMDTHPGTVAAILILHEGKFYRAATVGKNPEGKSLMGQEVKFSGGRDFHETVRRGEVFVGSVSRFGKLIAIAVEPLKDANGQVVGAILVRKDVEDSLEDMRTKIAAIQVGDSGYPFVVSIPASGNVKDSRFIIHPKFAGQTVEESGEAAVRVVTTLLNNPRGVFSYEWIAPDGQLGMKITQTTEIPALNWLVVVGSWEEEFTRQTFELRNQVIILSVVMAILMMFILTSFIRQRLTPVKRLVQAAKAMGDGDLTIALTGARDSQNEVSQLSVALGDSLFSVRRLLGDLRGSALELGGTANEMVKASSSLSETVDQQKQSTTAMLAATTQLSGSIDSVADNARAAMERSEHSMQFLGRSQESVNRAIVTMRDMATTVQRSSQQIDDLGHRSEQILGVLDTIGGIAEQTNLLALNASIEAARAGESGRGFAVVADEVRKLAEQSARSADEISGILRMVQNGVRDVSVTVSEAVSQADASVSASREIEQILLDLIKDSEQVSLGMQEIAQATREQSVMAQSMAEQVERVAMLSDQTSDDASHNLARASSLVEMAEKLEQGATRFRV